MSNIFIPIDSSDLRKVIPEGEDIIYSSQCHGEGTFMGINTQSTWKTHLLITKRGLYFYVPLAARFKKKHIKKLEPKPEVFVPWHNLGKVITHQDLLDRGKYGARKAVQIYKKTGKGTMIHITGLEASMESDFYRSCNLFLIRDSNFETIETFEQRNKEIKELINQFTEPIRLDIAKLLYEKFDLNSEYKIKEYRNEFGFFSSFTFTSIKKDWEKGLPPGASLVE